MNYHSRYAGLRQPVETCLIGAGAFGVSFIAQSRATPLVSARIAVDVTAEAAGQALAAAGIPRGDIRLCATEAEARLAFGQGHAVAAATLETVMPLPFSLVVEATGHPEAGARHALAAIEARRHVLLVTKETDSVAGPMLAHLASEAGVGITPVDGDQPSLLIDLVTWAQTLGFRILAAGKSSEYDFVFDPATGLVTSNGQTASLPGLGEWWNPAARGIAQVAAAREAELATAFPLRAVPDLCEMCIVANVTGLTADRPGFHAPVARIPEVAGLLRQGHGGLLGGEGRIDVFHHLRQADEASFAGGVFVIVACEDAGSWQVLAEKGHAVSADGRTAMIYLPRHLLGLEAATSILDLAGLGQSAYGPAYRPHVDLVAVATRDLAAGEMLTAKGHHHTIDGVGAEIRTASPIADDRTAPYYLVANRQLARPVRAGEPVRISDLAVDSASPLLLLRERQDSVFLSPGDRSGAGRQHVPHSPVSGEPQS